MNDPGVDDWEAPRRSPGLAIAALVLGVIGFVLSVFVAGGVLGLAGMVLATISLRRNSPGRGMAIAGIVLGSLSLLGGAAMGLFYYRAYTEYAAYFASMEESGADEKDGDDAGDSDDEHSAWTGLAVPPMTFTTLEGEMVDVARFAGKPVVLNFWATWCAACRQELPDLNRLAKEVPDIVVLGISDEDEDTLREFGRSNAYGYRMASLASPPAPFDGVHALPTTVFVDRKGVIRATHVGSLDFEELRSRATAPDFQPTAKPAPTADTPAPTEAWKAATGAVHALCICPPGNDQPASVVAATGRNTMRRFGDDGREMLGFTVSRLPGFLDCTRMPTGELRLLAYDNWGTGVAVYDGIGKPLWSYATPGGVNGAHWTDLEGDGTPEMVVGLNGDGGLHAVDSAGSRLWRVASLGNVWGQAVLAAAKGRPALIAAAEAGGTIRLFDQGGVDRGTLQPGGAYFTTLGATTAGESVQLAGLGREMNGQAKVWVSAFDSRGTVLWKARAWSDASWRTTRLQSGDLAGDAGREWVFPAGSRRLAVVGQEGTTMASLRTAARGAPFAVLPARPKDLLVVGGEDLTAYRMPR